MQGIEARETGPVFLSEVECTGSEERLTMCRRIRIGDHSCNKINSAGVACGKGM